MERFAPAGGVFYAGKRCLYSRKRAAAKEPQTFSGKNFCQGTALILSAKSSRQGNLSHSYVINSCGETAPIYAAKFCPEPLSPLQQKAPAREPRPSELSRTSPAPRQEIKSVFRFFPFPSSARLRPVPPAVPQRHFSDEIHQFRRHLSRFQPPFPVLSHGGRRVHPGTVGQA